MYPKYPQIATLFVGSSEEIVGNFVKVQEMPYVPHERLSFKPFEMMDEVAQRFGATAIVLMDPPSTVLEAVQYWVDSGHRFYIGLTQPNGQVEITELALPSYNGTARVFVSSPPEQHKDGTVMFSNVPRESLTQPAILHLNKVNVDWNYTAWSGGWVNPSALSTDLSRWNQAVEWKLAWRLQISTCEIS